MNFSTNDDTPEFFDSSDRDQEHFRDFIQSLPLIAPPEIAERLEQLGYKGQDEPRRALALMAYRHIRRLKRLHVNNEARRILPPKQNTLLVGPTGCGKTFLVESLFQQIFHLPTVIVDITSFTESGYIGDDVGTILTRLVYAAEGNLLLAACGIVCLDEFDKLASSTSNARFAGEGTTKDVSGYGVQRELLKIIEGADVMAVTEAALNHIVERSLKRGTGARGLHAGLIAAIEQAAFESFQRVSNAEIVIDLATGQLRSEVRRRA